MGSEMCIRDSPYSRSAFNRGYHANNKGINNINVYRNDNAYATTSKKDLSLSRNKYSFNRPRVHDLSLSKKQLAVGVNLTERGKRKEERTSNQLDVKT